MQSPRYLVSSSSKISHSMSSRETTILPGSQENSAPVTSNSPNVCVSLPITLTSDGPSSKRIMRSDRTSSGWPRSMTVTLSQVLEFFHVENFSNASEEESIFFFNLFSGIYANAKILQRDADGKCDRATQALVTALEEITGPPNYSILHPQSKG